MKIAYRPEIDGLRAISVFAVIIYHANFVLFNQTILKGGFIGVDIFFVISGYLITKLILKEIYRTNQFSFKKFYESRIRRILPTLLFVVIITSIVGYFILSPSSLKDLGNSIRSLIFFISNIYFWITGNTYGAESELLRPLLHTWSLSVEGQFYILFSLLFIILIKFFKKNFLIFIFIFFFFSLFLAHFFSTVNIVINYKIFRWNFVFFEKFNFYFLLSRIFELLIGSLLSYFELNNSVTRKSYYKFNQIFLCFGVILIFYSFLLFNFNKILHPSIVTLIPLIGVSLIIWFSKKGELVTEILSNKILVFFGLISYSLYLWHYPIFAFLRYVGIFNNSVQIKLLAILLTIILSVFTYHFIERPFRKSNIISTKKLTAYILVSTVILLSYSFYILKTEGIKSRFPNKNIFSEKLKENVEQTKLNELNKINQNERTVFLIGDSHATALAYHLNAELKKKSYSFYSQEVGLYLKKFNQINKKDNKIDKVFFETNEKIYKFLQKHENLIIVWHHRWTVSLLEEFFNNEEGYTEYQSEQDKYLNIKREPTNIKNTTLSERQNYIIKDIKSSIKEILEKGHSLIIVYPVPEMAFNVPTLLNQKYLYSKILNRELEVPILTSSYDVYKKRNKIIFNVLDNIQHPNLYRVYPHESFCNTKILNRCLANDEDHLFYYDDDHLSLEGSKYIVNDIIKVIGKIEINKKISR